MKTNLRNLILAPAAVVAFALASHAAQADTVAKVPFNFTVNGKICPAGAYTIHRDMNNSVVTLHGVDSKVTYMWNMRPGDAAPTATGDKLLFDAEGEYRALRFVQSGPLTTGRLDKKNSNQRERETLRVVAGQ